MLGGYKCQYLFGHYHSHMGHMYLIMWIISGHCATEGENSSGEIMTLITGTRVDFQTKKLRNSKSFYC